MAKNPQNAFSWLSELCLQAVRITDLGPLQRGTCVCDGKRAARVFYVNKQGSFAFYAPLCQECAQKALIEEEIETMGFDTFVETLSRSTFRIVTGRSYGGGR